MLVVVWGVPWWLSVFNRLLRAWQPLPRLESLASCVVHECFYAMLGLCKETRFWLYIVRSMPVMPVRRWVLDGLDHWMHDNVKRAKRQEQTQVNNSNNNNDNINNNSNNNNNNNQCWSSRDSTSPSFFPLCWVVICMYVCLQVCHHVSRICSAGLCVGALKVVGSCVVIGSGART